MENLSDILSPRVSITGRSGRVVSLSNGDRLFVTRQDLSAVVFDGLTPSPSDSLEIVTRGRGVVGGDFADIAALVAHLEAQLVALPVIAPVPAKVGPAQLRIALRRLQPEINDAAVYAVIATLPTQLEQDDARDLWEYATEIRRDHPVLAGLAAAFQLTNEQVDEVFRLAATL